MSSNQPALLVSYFYVKNFLKKRETFGFRDWVLDSGAFSAMNSGVYIDLSEYIEFCHQQLAEDSKLTEVYALDVIGDHRATRANAETMWAAGVQAIPCFHYGQPFAELESLAKEYPKIALGGAVGLHAKLKFQWSAQCFARVWPKKIHGFGMGGEHLLMALPFHSADASNWEIGPAKFGSWKTYGGLSVRGGNIDLRTEVDWYLALEAKLRVRWAKEMTLLDSGTVAPSVRSAYCTIGDRTLVSLAAPPPTLRLAVNPNPRGFAALRDMEAHTQHAPTVRLAYADGAKANCTLEQLGKGVT